MPNYYVISEFTAPKKEAEPNGERLQRLFKVGEYIAGSPSGYSKYKGEAVHVVLQKDGYMIPAKFLKQVNTVYSADGADESAQKMNEDVSKIVNKDMAREVLEQGKKSMQGLVIGTISGFAFALWKRQSLLWFGLIGGITGGYVGYKIGQMKNKKEFQ